MTSLPHAILASALLLAAGAPARAAEAPATLSVTLKVMTFNIWYGGEQVSFPKVVEAIQRSGADIVGVQEPDAFLDKLAEATGLTYTDHRRNIISRYPLFDSGVGERTDTAPSSYGTTALDADALFDWVMVSPGKVIAMANTHLTSDPYGPDFAKAGATPAQLMAMETKLRVPDAKPFAALAGVAAKGVPVFLTGDFNSPSNLDWTPPTIALHHRPYPFDWPAMGLLRAAGLRDSYREIHPDPVATPGFTWTAGQPNPYVRPEETPDRIDFILTAGPTTTLTSQLLGEAGGPDVDIAVSPWPSDHRSVVSTFRVVPANAPAMIAVEPARVVAGSTFMVRAYLPGPETFSALVVPRGADADRAITGVADETRGYRTGVRLASDGLAPGPYDAILVAPDHRIAARTRFAVVARDARPRIAVETSGVATGGTVRVRWSGAPGNRFDWIGIYKAGDPSVIANLINYHTDARLDGEAAIPLVDGDGKPLPPGRYDARLLRDDSFVVLATSAPFSVGDR